MLFVDSDSGISQFEYEYRGKRELIPPVEALELSREPLRLTFVTSPSAKAILPILLL